MPNLGATPLSPFPTVLQVSPRTATGSSERFLVGSCIRREPALQHTQAFIQWAAAKTR